MRKYWLILLLVAAACAGEDLGELAAKANSALRGGDYAGAERQYRRLVAAAPDMAEAYTNLGLSCHLQRHFSAAVEAFERGLKLRPDMASAWLFLGISYFDLNKPSRALTALKRFTGMRPDDFQGQYYTGLCLLSLDRNREAADQLKRAMQLDPRNVDGWYHLAQSNLRLAEAHVQERGTKGPDPAQFDGFRQGYEEAVAKIAAIDSKSIRIRQLRAGYFQATGEDQKAIAELQALASPELKITGIYYTLGCLYLRDREYDKAISAFESELRLAAPFPRTYLQLGHAWIAKEESARALPILAKAAKEEPESGVPWVEIGRARTKLLEYPGAIQAFLKAIELKEEKSSVYYLLGTAYRKAGKMPEANAAFQKSRQLSLAGRTRLVEGAENPEQ